eukprot:6289218-Lingulodinium_polyedra.AAC.1
MGRYVQAFADGEARARLPPGVRASIAKLAFIPTAERFIEAQHKQIKKAHGLNSAGPVHASLSMRATCLLDAKLVHAEEREDCPAFATRC